MFIGTTAMVIMLAIAIPLAYYMVFKAGKLELFILLSLVLADELAPVVKIYAWQVIFGRNGIINFFIPGPAGRMAAVQPVRRDRDALATTYITYTTIPIYAAMKAIDPVVFESAVDLGAGWWPQTKTDPHPARRAGHLHRDDPGVHPDAHRLRHVGHRGRRGSYMMGQRVRDLILQTGDWGSGSALNFIMLALSGVFSVVAFRLAKLNRIDT